MIVYYFKSTKLPTYGRIYYKTRYGPKARSRRSYGINNQRIQGNRISIYRLIAIDNA